MYLKRTAALALFALSITANTAWSASAITGSFLSADIGATQLTTPKNGFTNGTNTSVKRNTFTWGVSVGYNYVPAASHFFGVGMGFNHLGTSHYDGTVAGTQYNTTINQRDFDFLFDIGVVSSIGVNATLKLGAARVTQTTGGIDGTAADAYKRSNNNLTRYRPKAEVQVGYFAGNNLNVSLNFSHLFGRASSHYPINNTKIISNNSLTLNLQYTIPQ